MTIGVALDWVFQVIDSLFEIFRGIFFVLGFDIIAFIVICFGILAVLRMVTNGTLSLSKTIDIPKEPDPIPKSSDPESQGLRSTHKSDDISRE